MPTKLPYEARWRQPVERADFEGETNSMLVAIMVPLALAILLFSYILIRAAIAKRTVPNLEALVVGIVVNFFDTLGIGSFAPTTAWLKFRKLVPDRLIPPTMLVGLTPPSIVESIIFLILLGVLVDPALLIGCSLALLMGGLLGAPLVARSRVWVVQTVVAVALVLAAIAYAMTNLHLFPGGGTANGLPIGWMIVAIAASFVFGVLAQLRGRQLCAAAGHAEPDGHGPAAMLPDHGGGRVADRLGRERSPHHDRRDRSQDRPGSRHRGHSGGSRGGLHRQDHAA